MLNKLSILYHLTLHPLFCIFVAASFIISVEIHFGGNKYCRVRPE